MSENKTELAKQLLVRFIRDQEMKPGDKLPGQTFLREKFKVGTTTIAAAINTLKNDGVLEVRDKIGVFVIDPNADGHAGRIIGIVARWVEGSPYYSTLLGALQMNLTRRGCRVNIFCFEMKPENIPQTIFSMDDFPGLRRSVENHELDGLIHLDDLSPATYKTLARNRIPALFIGAQGGNGVNGLFYDQDTLLREMCEKLKELGAKRPALCLPTCLRHSFEPVFKDLTDGVGVVYSGDVHHEKQRIIDELLSRQKNERHDYILYFDDIMGQLIMSELALAMPAAALPRALICRNKQLMHGFPTVSPVFFTIDLVEVAEIASTVLLNAMKSNTLNIGRLLYNIKEGE